MQAVSVFSQRNLLASTRGFAHKVVSLKASIGVSIVGAQQL